MWHSTIDALNRMFHKLTCLRTNPLCIVETNPYLSIYNENRVNLWDISPNIIPNWRKPKRKKHKCMSIISLDPCQTWMKICFQHVGVLVHDFMNERRKKNRKKLNQPNKHRLDLWKRAINCALCLILPQRDQWPSSSHYIASFRGRDDI